MPIDGTFGTIDNQEAPNVVLPISFTEGGTAVDVLPITASGMTVTRVSGSDISELDYTVRAVEDSNGVVQRDEYEIVFIPALDTGGVISVDFTGEVTKQVNLESDTVTIAPIEVTYEGAPSEALRLVRVDVPDGILTSTTAEAIAYFNRTPRGTVEPADFETDGLDSAMITDAVMQEVALADAADLTNAIVLATLNEGEGTLTFTTDGAADAGTIAVVGMARNGSTLNETLTFSAGGEAQTTMGSYVEVTSATPATFTTGTVDVVLNNSKAYILTVERDLDDSGVLTIRLNTEQV